MNKEFEVSEAISKSLFFLGAGFSRDAGCLTSAQMIKDLKRKIIDQDSELSSVQKEAFKFLFSCLSYHAEWRTMEGGGKFEFFPNIEELALLIRRVRNRETFLPYPITGNWASKLGQLESEYYSEKGEGNLFDSLEEVLKKYLKNEWLSIESDEKLLYLKPLSHFFKCFPDQKFRLDIFSLNYDDVIERCFRLVDEIPWRGFSNGKWVNAEPDIQNDSNTRINLYKLHGSVDWVRLTDMDTWEKSKLLTLETDLQDNIVQKQDPYIIFGQGTKSFSVEPFFSLIHYFNSLLKKEDKKYFFVIGYSFFDPYINNILFNSLKDFKKLIIINPCFAPQKYFEIDPQTEWPKFDKENFFRAVFKEGCNESNITDFFRDIQKNSFYSELPEFNYLPSSAQNIFYIPLTAANFLENFLKNSGELLLKFIHSFEMELAEEEPF